MICRLCGRERELEVRKPFAKQTCEACLRDKKARIDRAIAYKTSARQHRTARKQLVGRRCLRSTGRKSSKTTIRYGGTNEMEARTKAHRSEPRGHAKGHVASSPHSEDKAG